MWCALKATVFHQMTEKTNLWLNESSFTFFSTAVARDIPYCLYEKVSGQPLPWAVIRPPTMVSFLTICCGRLNELQWSQGLLIHSGEKGGGVSWLLRKWNTFWEICSLSTDRECFVAARWSLDELIFRLQVQNPSGSFGSRWIAACLHSAIFALARGHCWPPFNDS